MHIRARFRNREAGSPAGRTGNGANPREHPHEVANGGDSRLQRCDHRGARVATLLLMPPIAFFHRPHVSADWCKERHVCCRVRCQFTTFHTHTHVAEPSLIQRGSPGPSARPSAPVYSPRSVSHSHDTRILSNAVYAMNKLVGFVRMLLVVHFEQQPFSHAHPPLPHPSPEPEVSRVCFAVQFYSPTADYISFMYSSYV